MTKYKFNKELEDRVSACMDKEDFVQAIEILANSRDERYSSIMHRMGRKTREYYASIGKDQEALAIARLLNDKEAIAFHTMAINVGNQMRNASYIDITDDGNPHGMGNKYVGI